VDSKDDLARLSIIKTRWSRLLEAHHGAGSVAQRALGELLLRYHGAVYRYLLGVLRDPAAAEEKTQEFAVRFLEGAFKGADPGQGRFRDYLKMALRNQCRNYWRAQERERELGMQPIHEDTGAAAVPAQEPAEADAVFAAAWQEELFARTWEALQRDEEENGTPYYTVMQLKTEYPKMHSAQLAELLAARLDRVLSEAALLQTVKRARTRFAELLVEEVAHSLGQPTPDELEQELIELELLDYCKSVLQRRARSAAPRAS
jgi:RNA polymerase sigma factor (sigma-70 family)